MAETHFTPGPLEALNGNIFKGKDCIGICDTDNLSDRHLRANANLWAAAPDLYAALEEARTSLMIVSEQALDASKTDARWLGVYEKLTPHIAAARSALSKARGETID